MESYDHVGFNNTKFRENPRGSCQKVVEMIWNDPFITDEDPQSNILSMIIVSVLQQISYHDTTYNYYGRSNQSLLYCIFVI